MVSQQFPNVSPDRWLDIRQVLHSDYHLTISADEGSDQSHGIQFAWLFSVPMLTVNITIPVIDWALKFAGIHCEEDAMDILAKKLAGVQ